MMLRILASAARCCWWYRSQGLRFGIWLTLIAFISSGVSARLNLVLHRHDNRGSLVAGTGGATPQLLNVFYPVTELNW